MVDGSVGGSRQVSHHGVSLLPASMHKPKGAWTWSRVPLGCTASEVAWQHWGGKAAYAGCGRGAVARCSDVWRACACTHACTCALHRLPPGHLGTLPVAGARGLSQTRARPCNPQRPQRNPSPRRSRSATPTRPARPRSTTRSCSATTSWSSSRRPRRRRRRAGARTRCERRSSGWPAGRGVAACAPKTSSFHHSGPFPDGSSITGGGELLAMVVHIAGGPHSVLCAFQCVLRSTFFPLCAYTCKALPHVQACASVSSLKVWCVCDVGLVLGWFWGGLLVRWL